MRTTQGALVNLLEPIYNYILKKGAYPREWAIALIHPIYKGAGNVKSTVNYRGIALLPTMGKLFTKILRKRFVKWLSIGQRDNDFQAGFKTGYSTMQQCLVLITLVQKTLSKRDRKLFVCYVDLKRAYDSVSRQALFFKMRKAGINNRFYLSLIHI